MLTISLDQMNRMQLARRERAVATLAGFMRDTQPAACLNLTDNDVEQHARHWLDLCVEWGITSVQPMCELFTLRARWGPFNDAESAWIMSVLEGPLPEDGKMNFLNGVLYGD